MHTTSPTLLGKLREPNSSAAWERFERLYLPLFCFWAREKFDLQDADAKDLVQDLFVKLVQELRNFTYDPAKGRFRGWLFTVFVRTYRDSGKIRAKRNLSGGNDRMFEVPAKSNELARRWDEEHNAYLVNRALRIIESELQPQTFEAFKQVVVHQREVHEVAASLNMSVGAIYVAKHRVMKRLRAETQDFLE